MLFMPHQASSPHQRRHTPQLFTSLDHVHAQAVAAEFARRPRDRTPQILTEADLARLPQPVARFVRASGSLDRPRPSNVRVELDALMRRKPGDVGMPSRCVQYSFFDRPARLFLLRAPMFGLPVRALHLYREERATFRVRIARLVDVVDLEGDEISRAETVTVLNDLVFLAPGELADDRLAWHPIDDRSAAVVFTSGPHSVAATLVFNDRDELVDFWSDDRPENVDGRLAASRWNTPMSGYRVIDGLRLPTRGAAVYAHPDGPFTYGEFTLRSIRYDLPTPDAPWLTDRLERFGEPVPPGGLRS